MTLEDVERDCLDALGPAPRAELVRGLMLPDYDRAGRDRRVLRQREDTVLSRSS